MYRASGLVFVIIGALAIGVGLLLPAAFGHPLGIVGPVSVSTDKSSYVPDETITWTSTGWLGQTYYLQGLLMSGSNLICAGDAVIADASGRASGTIHIYPYPSLTSGTYTVKVKSLYTSDSAETSITLTVAGSTSGSGAVTFYNNPASGTISLSARGTSGPWGVLPNGNIIHFTSNIDCPFPPSTPGPAGIVCAISANAPNGYVFSYWSTTGGVSVQSTYNNPTTFAVTDSGTITANFILSNTQITSSTGQSTSETVSTVTVIYSTTESYTSTITSAGQTQTTAIIVSSTRTTVLTVTSQEPTATSSLALTLAQIGLILGGLGSAGVGIVQTVTGARKFV